jgi:hygromycin-B 7''-O-kinase
MPWTAPTHDPARPLRDHLPEEGWRAAAAQLAARHGLPTSDLTPFASGSDAVWALGPGHVLKLSAPTFAAEIANEARCLDLARGRVPVRVPEVAALGDLDGWPYVITTRVPGEALGSHWPHLPRAERERLAEELGALVGALHRVHPGPPDHWAEFWRRCRTGVAARHRRPGVPEELLAEIEPFLAEVGELPATGRVFLHTEVLGEHLLVAPVGGRLELCSWIDFADACLGPVEYDCLAPVEFLFRGEAGLLRRFLLALGRDQRELHEGYSRQLLAWSLCHRFGSLARQLRAAPQAPRSLVDLTTTLWRV